MVGMSSVFSVLTSGTWKLYHPSGGDTSFVEFDLSASSQALEPDKQWQGNREQSLNCEDR
jgi:hypothetical protein